MGILGTSKRKTHTARLPQKGAKNAKKSPRTSFAPFVLFCGQKMIWLLLLCIQ
jgi:hypothetical protein